MKKFLMILVLVVMLVALIVPMSMAEAVDAAPVLFDWTTIVTDILVWLTRIISGAVVGLLGYLGKKYALPWLKETRLTSLAQELVKAAEARFGRKQGEEKLHAVFDWLRIRGIDVNDDRVVQAVLAAWQDLDLEMIAIGVKEPPDQPE